MITNDEIGSQLVIFELFREIWISFRGTQIRGIEALKKDLLIDLHMKQKSTSYLHHDGCKVHSGFDHRRRFLRMRMKFSRYKKRISGKFSKKKFFSWNYFGLSKIVNRKSVKIAIKINSNFLGLRR